MASRLKFVDELPTSTPPKRLHYTYAEQLRANPMRWAPVSTHANEKAAAAMAWQTNHGKRKPYPEGFEAKAIVEKGVPTLYVRYIGKESQSMGVDEQSQYMSMEDEG